MRPLRQSIAVIAAIRCGHYGNQLRSLRQSVVAIAAIAALVIAAFGLDGPVSTGACHASRPHNSASHRLLLRRVASGCGSSPLVAAFCVWLRCEPARFARRTAPLAVIMQTERERGEREGEEEGGREGENSDCTPRCPNASIFGAFICVLLRLITSCFCGSRSSMDAFCARPGPHPGRPDELK